MAYCSKYLERINNRYFAIVGDGESQEGQIWEAAQFASHYKLDNLIAVIDVNRLGQTGVAMLEHDVATYVKRFEAFGFFVQLVDGHDIPQILNALEEARNCRGKPCCLIAKTMKGKYFGEEIENLIGWHGKPMKGKTEAVVKGIRAHIVNKDAKLPITLPKYQTYIFPKVETYTVKPDYKKDQLESTRSAYGHALLQFGPQNIHNRINVLDAETSGSTCCKPFGQKYPRNFVECYIMEQNMVSAAAGFAARRRVPFVSTFAAFFSRAYDQIRIVGLSKLNVKFVGSHVGVSIGGDGPTQMGLEDLAMFRAIPGSVVFYPSDAVSAQWATMLSANRFGLDYIRTSRPKTQVPYPGISSLITIDRLRQQRNLRNRKVQGRQAVRVRPDLRRHCWRHAGDHAPGPRHPEGPGHQHQSRRSVHHQTDRPCYRRPRSCEPGEDSGG